MSVVRALAVAIYRRVPLLPSLYRPVRNVVARALLRRQIRHWQRDGTPCRVVVGANRKFQEGWVGIERYTLDVTKEEDWARCFAPGDLDTILAEHVWEHLPEPQAQKATRLCFQYLKPGGRFRVAVPDGRFPDARYVEFVRPGGSGPGAWDHHVLYTEESLRRLLERAGFEVTPLEYFDESGCFRSSDWSVEQGYIRRSARFYREFRFGDHYYTSLILDGTRPPAEVRAGGARRP